ncbi:MAG: T9SS type A sorting domain-containing protein [Bacteroidetes bacterium]|nr:T9SS type A sorting domain-containing protein [Bacteroidota bacterium]
MRPTINLKSKLKQLLLLAIAVFGFQIVSATSFYINVYDASTANVQQSATNEEIFYIRVSNPNGGGQSNGTITGIDFTPLVDEVTDVSSAKLYRTTSSTFNTTNQVGSADTDLSDGISFSFTQTINKGNTYYYFWLTYDITGTADTCNEFYASIAQTDITTTETIASWTDNTAGSGRVLGPGAGCWNYCDAYGSNDVWGWVDEVQFNTISNQSGSDKGYLDATSSNSTTVYQTYSYVLTIDVQDDFPGGPMIYTGAWIDFNNDGDFADAGENVAADSSIGSTATGTYTRTVTVNIPSGATIGQTTMRIAAADQSIPTNGCGVYTYQEIEDYTIDIQTATNMAYLSSTTTQGDTTDVSAGTYTQEIIGIEIEMDNGILNPLAVTSFTLSNSGTNNPGTNISNAKLYSTGSSPSFGTTVQYGSTVASPGSAYNITGSLTLNSGVNYFWLTYDIPTAANNGEQVDASCILITIGSIRTPTVTNPGSGRTILGATQMIFNSCTISQNTSAVPIGSTENHVITMEIDVDGALNPFDVTSFSITENSTNASNDIENAKIFYGGLSSSYSTSTQFGSTVVSPSGSYTITGTETLLNGVNYFFLSYDTKSGATGGNVIDAHCTSITIDSNNETPILSAPLGSRTIISLTPYYSAGSLNVNLLSSWNSARDGTGSAPSSFSSSYSFWVQNGHTMTTSNTRTIPYLFIEDGGWVTASWLITMTDLVIQSGGTFKQTASASYTTYITNFTIENEGSWIHHNTGYLPGVNRYFSPTSYQWFTTVAPLTFPANTAWGNVIIDVQNAQSLVFNANTMSTVQGDLEWRTTGQSNNWMAIATDNSPVNIDGDLIISGGVQQGAYDLSIPGNQQAIIEWDVAGNFEMTAGQFNDYKRGKNTSATYMHVGGDITISGGTFDFNTASSGESQINMTGGRASVNWTQSGGTVSLANVYIKSGKTVTVQGSKLGDVASGKELTIEAGGTMHMQTYAVEGGGDMNVNSGSTIGLGATNTSGALTSTASEGNVQVTGTRTFDQGGAYIYNGVTSPQYTGDQLPTTITGGLEMDNSATDATIELTQNTTVDGTLSLTNGDLITTSTEIITIGAGATITPTRGSDNSFVSKWIDIEANATSDFEVPIGSSPDNRWRPMTITPADATTRTWRVEFIDEDPNTDLGSTYLTTDSVDTLNAYYYYDVDNQANDGATIDLKIFYQDIDMPTIDETKTVIGHWDSGNSLWDAFDKDDLIADWNRDISSNWVQTVGGANTFSPVAPGGGAGGGVLPIELLTFDANATEESQVLLTWSTLSEINNSLFTLERSVDGMNYKELKTIQGAGNSTTLTEYQYLDLYPKNGTNYYRLKQVDMTGKKKVVGVRSVTIKKQTGNDLIIYPLPANDLVTLEFSSTVKGPAEILIFDIAGKQIMNESVELVKGFNELQLELSLLSRGIYQITLQNQQIQLRAKLIRN